MFSFGSKVKQKLTATRFEFSFVVHNLAPWPEGARAIAIGYQRGKRRRGATRSIYPSRQPGRLGAVVRFNERFDMPVTLYKANSGNSVGNGGLGPFKKKCLILAVLETDGRTQATAALGRVVVDLSEYASIEHQETRTFMVSCNKAIHAAVGDPQLMVTIRCRWKKMREGSGAAAAGVPDETASMSTDTTGSRMTANLSSFLRFKFTGKGNGPLNEEQDLRGFESASGLHHAGSGASAGSGLSNGGARGSSMPGDQPGAGLSKVMDTIQESHDEPSEPVFTTSQAGAGLTPQASTSRSMTPQTSIKQLTPTSSIVGPDPSPRSGVQHPMQTLGSTEGDASSRAPAETSVVGLTLREMHAARSRQAAAAAAAAAGGPGAASPGGLRVDLLGNGATPGDSATSNNSLGSMGPARKSGLEGDRSYGNATLAPAGSGQSLVAGVDADLLAALRFELLTAAALEASVYLPRRPPGAGLGTMAATGVVAGSNGPGSFSAVSAASSRLGAAAGGTVSSRLPHAPARRVVRTILGMGPADGPHFGAAALRVVRAQVAAAGSDGLDVLSYWWSNIVQMRAMLTCLQPGPGGGGMLALPGSSAAVAAAAAAGPEHWAAAALVPELRRLERALFEEVVVRMWERVLLPTVLGVAAAGGAPSSRATAGGGAAGAVPGRPSTAVTKRAQQEAAIKKWFEALEAVCTVLGKQVGPGGHSALLRHQVLLQCLKRVDLLLFAHLLGGTDQPGVAELLTDYDPHRAVMVVPPSSLQGASGVGSAAVSTMGGHGVLSGFPHLDDSSLPFARGVLTFGGGMSVKMTVTRLQQWAAAHPALGGGAAGGTTGSAAADCGSADRGGGGVGTPLLGPLFPLLRSAADLLMMPKELLMDRAVRLDMGAALSMRSVLHILERFKPDEFAQDSISPAILQSLQDDAALPQMHLRSAAADVNSGYLPPSDTVVLRGVEAGAEPGLEYDPDSEDELDELGQVVARSSIATAGSSGSALGSLGNIGGLGLAGGGASSATRFRLLHDMWSAGRPRRRGAYSVASEPN